MRTETNNSSVLVVENSNIPVKKDSGEYYGIAIHQEHQV